MEVKNLTDTALVMLALGCGQYEAATLVSNLRGVFGLEVQAKVTDCQPLALRLLAGKELFTRALYSEAKQQVMGHPRAFFDYLRTLFAGQEFESFWCLWLNANNELISAEEMFHGTLTQTSVYPREVVKRALHLNAASVIVSHNHPSGNPRPSSSDERLTVTLKSALSLVDVRVLDHIVVAKGDCYSFAEHGLI
ncbi:DNA repair protein RadC (plasmid) [Polaromonas sp. P1-6]|nr:DNA repair protein RadC [Polaromonas sp. P1-6]